MLCVCQYGPALLRFWFQTNLRPENSASYVKMQAAKTFSYHGHALVKLYRWSGAKEVNFTAYHSGKL